MALSFKEGGKGRSLDQFIEVAGKTMPTKRPSSHTVRADDLGLETRRHPLRGRGHTINDYHQGSELVPIGEEDMRIKLPQPRPELSPKVHVEHSATGQVTSSECQPSFARTRRYPFVVSEQSPTPAAFQASSRTGKS